MSVRLKRYSDTNNTPDLHILGFHCPGCKYDHAFTVGRPNGSNPRWTWNSSYDLPTFQPSLLCNQDTPEARCHSYVTDGKIQFLSDCWHPLAGKTVDLPEFDSE